MISNFTLSQKNCAMNVSKDLQNVNILTLDAFKVRTNVMTRQVWFKLTVTKVEILTYVQIYNPVRFIHVHVADIMTT